jgi:hypothetical protein
MDVAWCCARWFRKISTDGAKCAVVTANGSPCGNQSEWCITQTLNKIVTCLQLGVAHETVNGLPVRNTHSVFLSTVHSLEKSI